MVERIDLRKLFFCMIIFLLVLFMGHSKVFAENEINDNQETSDDLLLEELGEGSEDYGIVPYVETAPQTGHLKITKTVTGEGADTEKEFTFTITLSDTSINDTYGDITFENGVATIKLKHGESKVALDLPANITYEVVESDNEGYVVTSIDAEGTVPLYEMATAAFTNTKAKEPELSEEVPETGDDVHVTLGLFLMSILVMVLAGLFMVKMRKNSIEN